MVCIFHHLLEVASLLFQGATVSDIDLQVERNMYLLLFDQSPSVAFSASTCSSPHTMNIFAHIDRNVVADNVRYITDVDTSGNEVGANKSAFNPINAAWLGTERNTTDRFIFSFLNCSKIVLRS